MAEVVPAPDETDVPTAPKPSNAQPGSVAAAPARLTTPCRRSRPSARPRPKPTEVADEQQVAMSTAGVCRRSAVAPSVEESAAAEPLEEAESEVAMTAPVAQAPPARPPQAAPGHRRRGRGRHQRCALCRRRRRDRRDRCASISTMSTSTTPVRRLRAPGWSKPIMDLPRRICDPGRSGGRRRFRDRPLRGAVRPRGRGRDPEANRRDGKRRVADAVAGAMPEVERSSSSAATICGGSRARLGQGHPLVDHLPGQYDDQIRNPNRIYPGQVFVMPKGDAAWAELTRARRRRFLELFQIRSMSAGFPARPRPHDRHRRRSAQADAGTGQARIGVQGRSTTSGPTCGRRIGRT
jgi:hypothetical protein